MNNTGFGCSIVVLILHEENFTSRKYLIYGRLHGLSIYLHVAAYFIIGMYGYQSSARTFSTLSVFVDFLTQPVRTLGIIPQMKLLPIKILVN
jgi:hypothetical protein